MSDLSGLWEQFVDGPTEGKSIKALLKSRAKRNALIALFGGKDNLPSSIMKADRTSDTNRERDDSYSDGRKYSDTGILSNNPLDRKTKHLKGAFTLSGQGVRFGALSVFPQNICKSMVLLYSEPGQVVVDPFAGHNSRMECVVRCGRNYIGCDLSRKFMENNRKRAKVLRKKFPSLSITLHEGDSRKLGKIPDETGDMTITSPPYYDLEFYGDEPEQMAKCPSYKDFIKAMGVVLKENFRVLKPGAYAAWFINDFRKEGVFYSYHSDIIRYGIKAGFRVEDTLIVDFGRGFRDAFVSQSVEQRIIPKRHEYGIIFRRP